MEDPASRSKHLQLRQRPGDGPEDGGFLSLSKVSHAPKTACERQNSDLQEATVPMADVDARMDHDGVALVALAVSKHLLKLSSLNRC